jgi:hypothetical protein
MTTLDRVCTRVFDFAQLLEGLMSVPCRGSPLAAWGGEMVDGPDELHH